MFAVRINILFGIFVSCTKFQIFTPDPARGAYRPWNDVFKSWYVCMNPPFYLQIFVVLKVGRYGTLALPWPSGKHTATSFFKIVIQYLVGLQMTLRQSRKAAIPALSFCHFCFRRWLVYCCLSAKCIFRMLQTVHFNSRLFQGLRSWKSFQLY